MDTITIQNLELQLHIGVPPEERAAAQRVLLSARLHVNTRAAGKSDSISDTVDYEHIIQSLRNLAEKERHTLEYLAEDAATACLIFEGIESVDIEVKKFIFPDTEYISVQISRP